LNLLNKNILITGSSRGLGFELAKNLWNQGANLFLVSRTKSEELQKYFLENRIDLSQRFVWYKGDLSIENCLKQIFTNFTCMFGDIDVLINNAAIQQPIGNFYENDWYKWEKCISVNLFAPAKLIKYFIPNMLKRNCGKIINLSGGGSTSSRPYFSAYAVAKTGLIRLTEIVSDELKDSNITINCVAPGAMNTSMMDEILESNSGEKEINIAKEVKNKNNTMDKGIELINWLISDESNHITGRLIAAQWDDYKNISIESNNNLYKLRRINE
jgi:3-oxoacyl-[acyl-carrier protein] reductase